MTETDRAALVERLQKLHAALPSPFSWESVNEQGDEWCMGVSIGADDQPIAGELQPGDESVTVDELVAAGENIIYGRSLCELRNLLPAILAALEGPAPTAWQPTDDDLSDTILRALRHVLRHAPEDLTHAVHEAVFFEIRKAMAAPPGPAAEGPAPTTWQPMGTAPKREGQRLVITRIERGEIWWVSLGEWSDRWQRFWDRIEPSGFAGPTHWMPVPAPPASASRATEPAIRQHPTKE